MEAGDPADAEEPQPKHVTIADAMNRVKDMDKSLKVSSYKTRIVEEDVGSQGHEYVSSQAIFQTNERLRAMAESMPTVTGTMPYTMEEVKRAVNDVVDIDVRNKVYHLNLLTILGMNR